MVLLHNLELSSSIVKVNHCRKDHQKHSKYQNKPWLELFYALDVKESCNAQAKTAFQEKSHDDYAVLDRFAYSPSKLTLFRISRELLQYLANNDH